MNKILNSICFCNKALSLNKDSILMILPCEHMIHNLCYNNSIYTCPICNNKIKNIIGIKDAIKMKDYQKYSDILSVTNYDYNTNINYLGIFGNTISIIDFLLNIPLSNGYEDGKILCKKIFNLNNMKITVYGLNKIKNEKKVFISNHSSYLDPIILFYILNCGFVASSFVTNNIIGRKLVKIIPTLIINRGKKTNTVDKMKEYINKNGSICIFPEGMITHPKTISRFRSGAFNTGFPVYPVVILYDNAPADHESMMSYILKICSNKKIDIKIKILDPYYPINGKFDKDTIEEIRYNMSRKGDLLMSRVSNKDLSD